MKTDAIIVGSGIIGMSLAIILSKNNKNTIIIEKNLSNNLNNRRVYALSEKTKGNQTSYMLLFNSQATKPGIPLCTWQQEILMTVPSKV